MVMLPLKNIANHSIKTPTFNILVSIIIFCSTAFPQSDSTIISNDLLDDFVEDQSDEAVDNSDKYDSFESLLNSPVKINNADIFELQKIPYIDLNIAKQIIDFRKKSGYIYSLKELSIIPGLTEDILNKISPFISFDSDAQPAIKSEINKNIWDSLISDFNIKYRYRTYEDLQVRKGFTDNYYLGSPYKIYNRLQTNWAQNFGINLLTEKDPGEKQFNDFLSFNLWLKKIWFVKTLVGGDYSLSFGQGLLLWGPYASPMGSDAFGSIIRRGSNVTPFSGSNEYSFLRGAAATLNLGSLFISPFYSYKYFDARIDSINNLITSISIDGYHRTLYEISNKNNSFEKMVGINFNYSIKNFFNIGSIFYQSSFSKPLIFNNSSAIKSRFNCFSFYYDIYFKNIEIAGEAANDGIYTASINHIQFYVTKELNFTASFRSYPSNYKNLHGIGFGENSNINNEKGFYSGTSWMSNFGRFGFFFDLYEFPSSSYYNILPSNGKEFYLRFDSKRFSNSTFIFRYIYSCKDISLPDYLFKESKEKSNHNIRLELRNYLKGITLYNRLEYFFTSPTTNKNYEKGMLIMEGLKFTPLRFINAACRIMLFRTDSYSSSIYEYEDDFSGIVRSYALYGEGMRWYLLLRIFPFKGTAITFKYSETFKPEEKNLGSGYSIIEGNIDNQIGMQLDINL